MEISKLIARDLSEAWFLCLNATLMDGHEYKVERGSYTGQLRKELDFVIIEIRSPGVRPLIPDVPPGIPPPTSMDYIQSYLPYLMTAHKKQGEQYTYGEYLESQINEVIRIYKMDGYNTNQGYMTIGDKESIKLSDPPCLRGIDTKIRDGRLHFFAYFRSWDLWAGFPSNLAAIQLLKEYMALAIGVLDGEIIACSKGLHLYEYAWELASGVTRAQYKLELQKKGQLELDFLDS